MAYFLFIDESGQDRRESPYEVLAGIAIQDRDLWNLVRAVQDAELRCFGRRYSEGRDELKARRLLKRKVFRLATQLPEMPADARSALAYELLKNPTSPSRQGLTALSQAKLAYVEEILDICARFRCRVFASIVDPDAPAPPVTDFLRKDYAYLFERFYYFLEDADPGSSGIVVFDELDKAQSHLLLSQMDRYFKRTRNGRQRAGRIIPEPFFVHSDLTTGVQIADLVAYLVSWGFRIPPMVETRREELTPLVDRVCQLRHRAIRERGDNPNFAIWSFAVISDLRAREPEGD